MFIEGIIYFTYREQQKKFSGEQKIDYKLTWKRYDRLISQYAKCNVPNFGLPYSAFEEDFLACVSESKECDNVTRELGGVLWGPT